MNLFSCNIYIIKTGLVFCKSKNANTDHYSTEQMTYSESVRLETAYFSRLTGHLFFRKVISDQVSILVVTPMSKYSATATTFVHWNARKAQAFSIEYKTCYPTYQ